MPIQSYWFFFNSGIAAIFHAYTVICTFTNFLFLSYPSMMGPHWYLFSWLVGIGLHHRYGPHRNAGLECTMMSSGCWSCSVELLSRVSVHLQRAYLAGLCVPFTQPKEYKICFFFFPANILFLITNILYGSNFYI